MPHPDPHRRPPEQVGPYKLEKPLGQGGMGSVWRAWDERLKRQVALKRFRPDVEISSLRERFLREARATAALKHPSIVHIYDIVEQDGDEWIVMELVAGETLERLLRTRRTLPIPQILDIGRQIAEGLAEAHGQGILHRDLKLANVMVTPAGHVKLLDFGLAKHFLLEEGGSGPDEPISRPGMLLGTVHAMSPEQVQGHALDARSDLFSFGSLLYGILTGLPAFHATTPLATLVQILSHDPRPITEIRPEVPSELCDLVRRLLAKDRRHRPESAAEVAADLAAIARRLAESPAGERVTQAATILEPLPGGLWQRMGPPAPLPDSERQRILGEHRPLTVVCCGLVGLEDAASGPLDLEILSEAIDDFEELVREVCRKFRGQPGGTLGQVLWFSFGYPQAHEDDVQRAVQAACELSSRIAEISPRLALRAAVHTGPALVVLRGRKTERLQPGPTLDLAIDLENIAPAGQVVVSATARLLILRSFQTEPLPPVHLPSASDVTAIYRVLGPVASRDRESGSLTPLIGRDRELDLLVERFQLARSGSGQVVLLSGEPGIGKSRLVNALKERLAEDAPVWQFAYGSQTSQSAPLAPILDLLDRAVFESHGNRSERSLSQLEEFLGRHRLSLTENVPLLAPLLSLQMDNRYPLTGLSPNAQRKKTFESLIVLFAGMAERGPLVLVVEDLHWIDPSTLDFLSLLIEEVVALPLMLILTLRPEFQIPWSPRSFLTQLGLSRLTQEETRLLIDLLATGKTLPERQRKQILRQAEGVPFFAEELIQTLLENNRGTDLWEIPVTLAASLAARLDRSGPAKEVAQVASVIGRTFSRELLGFVAPLGEAAIEEGVRELARAELIYRRGLGPQARYVFKHALIQDAAYASLLTKDRQILHLQMAGLLEDQLSIGEPADPEGKQASLLELAHHWSKALDPRDPDPILARQAIPRLLAAGEHTARLGAYREAREHLNLALALIPALTEGTDRDELELTVLVRLIVAVKMTQGMATTEVRSLQERMHHLARGLESHPDLAQVLHEIWAYHVAHMELEESRAIALEWLDRFQEPYTRLMASRCASHSLYFLGRLPESLHYSETVLAVPVLDREGEIFGPDGASRLFAAHQSSLSLIFLGLEEEALIRHRHAMEMTDRIPDPFIKSLSLGECLKFLRRRQDVEAAVERAEQLRCLMVELELSPLMLLAMYTRSWALMMRGHALDAVEDAEAGLELHKKFFLSLGNTSSYTSTALIYIRAGRLERSKELLDQALETVSRGGLFHEAELYCVIGELHLTRARRDSSTADLDQAEKMLRKSFNLARQRYQVLIAQEAVSLLVPLLESQGWHLAAAEVEIEMQRLREDAAARAEKILAETGSQMSRLDDGTGSFAAKSREVAAK